MMLNINSLIDIAKLGDQMLLVAIEPAYVYEDGHATEQVSGYKYTVVLPAQGYEKLAVKIDGKQLLDSSDVGQLVTFDNLKLRLFSLEGQHTVRVSAKADSVSLSE